MEKKEQMFFILNLRILSRIHKNELIIYSSVDKFTRKNGFEFENKNH